jgi:hypothetical protein
MRKVRHRGVEKVGWVFHLRGGLVRIKTLLANTVGAA